MQISMLAITALKVIVSVGNLLGLKEAKTCTSGSRPDVAEVEGLGAVVTSACRNPELLSQNKTKPSVGSHRTTVLHRRAY